MKPNKEFDIIVWGASGFTGRLVAEYLFKTYGTTGNLKWAMAGRNQDKLKSVRNEIADETVPIVIGDSQDEDSLNQLVQRTRVICTTVGPYAKYGSKLVAACVKHQTDYCDLCGEVQWMRRMIDQHHETAKANGTRIVHTCGFDSIPSDMGVFFFQEKIKEKTGDYFNQIKFRVKAISGGMSGGTVASMNYILEEASKDKSIFKILNNPYGLNPKGEQTGPDKPDLQNVIYDEDLESWISPFLMAIINTKVVRRSNALRNYPFGKDFRYDEALLSGKGFGGRVKGIMTAIPLGLLALAKPNSLLKKGLDRILPKPGEGPSKEQREKGFFNIVLLGILNDGTKLQAKVTGDRDPGYGSTAKMLGECAVCLAKDKAKTPKAAGVLTPSVAMGNMLLHRLQDKAGLRFEIL